MRTLLPFFPLLLLLAAPVLAGEASSEKSVRWTTAANAERVHALKARLDATAKGAVTGAPAAGAPERLASGGERQRVPVEAFQVLWLRPAAAEASGTAPRAVCRAASEAAPGPAAVLPTAVEK